MISGRVDSAKPWVRPARRESLRVQTFGGMASSTRAEFMGLIAKDLPTLVFMLLPGFIAAGIYYTLTPTRNLHNLKESSRL